MNALAFLSARSGVALARSPMEGMARAAGARFQQRDGWNVAVAFPGDERRRITETVGYADRCHVAKFEIHGASETPAHAITPERALAIDPPERPPDAIDVTCAFAAMSLAGPGSRELLARFCAIDVRERSLPVGGFRPGSVARTPGYLLREGESRLLLLVGWALGEYLWEVVADAAQRLGGGPVGADALALKPEVASA